MNEIVGCFGFARMWLQMCGCCVFWLLAMCYLGKKKASRYPAYIYLEGTLKFYSLSALYFRWDN